MSMLREVLRRLGPLRSLLFTLAVLLIAISPFAGGKLGLSGWPLVTTLIAPTCFAVLMFMLPLDLIMSSLFMKEAEEAARGRYRFVIRLELVVLAVMFASWLPFLVRLLRGVLAHGSHFQ